MNRKNNIVAKKQSNNGKNIKKRKTTMNEAKAKSQIKKMLK